MTRHRIPIASLALISVLLVIGCAPGATPLPATPGAVATAVAAKTSWQEDWENTVAVGRQEGKISIMSSSPLVARGFSPQVFKEKYGIEMEAFIGTPDETWVKIEAERRNGIYQRDIISTSVSSIKSIFGSLLDPMEPILVLPEVKDGNAWTDKKLPFFSDDGKSFMYLSRVGTTILVNKDMVKPEELKSWRNLLDPKWKGQILLFDPSIGGSGQYVVTTAAELMGDDFLRELAKQDPVINRDKRLQIEWVARGKYPIALGFDGPAMEDMRTAGAPFAHVVPQEGTNFGSGTGGIAVFNKPPHPYATKVFINWFLSKEGQTLMAKAAKDQSRRVDVPSELPADRLFQPGIRYIDSDSKEFADGLARMTTLSKEIFAAQFQR